MKIRKHQVPVVRINKGECPAWSMSSLLLECCDKIDKSHKVLCHDRRNILFKGKPSWRKLERLVCKMNLPKGFVLPITIWIGDGKAWRCDFYYIHIH